jgi:hypothetical protein
MSCVSFEKTVNKSYKKLLFRNNQLKAKTMEDPNDKRFRVRQVVIFTILMGGALASVIALYTAARPFIEDLADLNIALVAAIIFITGAYVMAIKTGIPPKPPRTEGLVPRVSPPSPPEVPINPGEKHGIPKSTPKASVSSGIPPSPRKNHG